MGSAAVLLAGASTAGVPAFAVAITLVAAVLHAVWNAVAHGIPDRLVGFALIGVAYTVIAGAGALVLGLPPAAAWPAIVASAGLHAVYTLLLWTSYELGDFSQVYPVARGSAPLTVVAIETALGRDVPALQLLGIAVISLGLISLALDGGRPSRASLPGPGRRPRHRASPSPATPSSTRPRSRPPRWPSTRCGCSCSRAR